MVRADSTRPDQAAASPLRRWAVRLVMAAGLGAGLGACNQEVQTRGYVIDERLLQQIKPGTDAQTVITTLGSPSTVSTVGNQTWYYISQQTKRSLAFMDPAIVDQRVLALTFNKNMKVERIASYGLQDGVIFDFISRTTPTGGNELSVVRQLLRATGQGII